MMKARIFALLLPLLISISAQAISIPYTWAAPTTGGIVEYYEIEMKTDDGEWLLLGQTVTENTAIIEMPIGSSVIRVRGVNTAGPGPWSPESIAYTAEEPPGICGRPSIMR